MKSNFFFVFCLSIFSWIFLSTQGFIAHSAETLEYPKKEIDTILELKVDAPISPAVLEYLRDSFSELDKPASTLVLIHLNTPGGLVTTTKEILTLIGEAEFPVAVWITPEGASATSAGAIIASGAHFIFMNEGTNMGAATPITLSGDIKESDGRSKMINDLMALVRSLSEARGRRSEPFVKMVQKAESYSAKEAEKEKIINGILVHRKNIGKFIDNQVVRIRGKDFVLNTSTPLDYEVKKMNFSQRLLNTFAHPETAYILFIIGVALIYFELQAPGGYVAGGIGVMSLILAGIGFQVLPLNFGAMGLIVLSFILFILEAFITSYGLLLFAGLVALISGSLFLFKTDDSIVSLGYPLIVSTALGVVVYVGLISWFVVRERKKFKNQKFFNFKNEKARVIAITSENETTGSYTYQVRIMGETWNATSSRKLELDSEVSISQLDENHLTLKIE